MSIPGLWDAIGLFGDEELVGTWEDRFIAADFDFAALLSSTLCSCILFAIVLGQLVKLEFLAPASRAGMDDVEQLLKIVPFVTCEMTLGQDVLRVVNVSNLNFRIKIISVTRRAAGGQQ